MLETSTYAIMRTRLEGKETKRYLKKIIVALAVSLEFHLTGFSRSLLLCVHHEVSAAISRRNDEILLEWSLMFFHRGLPI